MSRTLFFATLAVLVVSSLAATCTKPKIKSTTFTTRDATIVMRNLLKIYTSHISLKILSIKGVTNRFHS